MIFILSYGDISEEVKEVQRILNNLGFQIKVDGIYGANTMNAVKEFQISQGIVGSGKIDEVTAKRLMERKNRANVLSYINNREFSSNTPYLLYTNLVDHLVYIFKGKNHSWQLLKLFPATVGKKETPTLKGYFKVGAKGPGYGGPHKGFKVKWYTQFYHNYLFHSILYNLDGTIYDGRLGENLSDGCIRLRESDAKYIYDTVPWGSLVYIE